MQRVVRDTQASKEAAATLEETVAVIRQHFPPSIAHLYAIRRQGRDGVLEWWSELAGQPHLYTSLDRQQQATLLQLYEERQAAVAQLAQELARRGQAGSAAALNSLVGPPDLNNLYSVNGEPLVIRWGQPAPAPAPKPAPVSSKTPEPVVAIPAPAPKPITARPVARRRRVVLWPWLLALLLLALLYWLYLY